MSVTLQEVLGANDKYAASFGDKANLALPPARAFAIRMNASRQIACCCLPLMARVHDLLRVV